MKKALLPLLVLLLAAGIAVVLIFSRPEPPSRIPEIIATPVDVIPAEARKTTLVVQSQGTVSPRLEATLAAEVGGLVREVSPDFETGQFVTENEVLLKLDPTDYEAAVAEAKANLRSALTSLAQAEADAEQAIRDLEKVGVTDPSPLARREPQLEQARLRVDSARAALALAEKNLARTSIRAPFDGLIIEALVDRGDVLANRGTPVATLYGTGEAEIELSLSRTDLLLLTLPDNPREIAADPSAKPEVSFVLGPDGSEVRVTGWVDRLAGSVDPVTRLQKAIAILRDPLDLNGDGSAAIPFGSFVSAEIQGQTIESAFRIPVVALIGEDRVRVVDPENRLHEREVEVIQRTPTEIVIRGGLEDGYLVCLTPLKIFSPGMLVRPMRNGEDLNAAPLPTDSTAGEVPAS